MSKVAIITHGDNFFSGGQAVSAKVGHADLKLAYRRDLPEETNHKLAAITLAQRIHTSPKHITSARVGGIADEWAHIFEF